MTQRISRRGGHGRARSEHGFILVVGLLFLIVLTLLSVAMFRSFGLRERIAGNTLDKLRAFEAAQSALQHAEWWLGQGIGIGTGLACSGVRDGNDVSAMTICSDALSNPMQLPWPARTDYLPPGMVVSTAGGVAPNGDINYHAKPGLHISYLGVGPDGLSQLYRVSAFGYGGNPDSAAVVRSTYQIQTGVKDLGGL
jgi:type IV pilus assembly protein PilX